LMREARGRVPRVPVRRLRRVRVEPDQRSKHSAAPRVSAPAVSARAGAGGCRGSLRTGPWATRRYPIFESRGRAQQQIVHFAHPTRTRKAGTGWSIRRRVKTTNHTPSSSSLVRPRSGLPRTAAERRLKRSRRRHPILKLGQQLLPFAKANGQAGVSGVAPPISHGQVAWQAGPQSMPISPPFFMPSEHVGAWQMPAQQTALVQSDALMHPSPTGHRGHDGAPQSVPVSVSLNTPSKQLGTWHAPMEQTPV
jgi:hypothetical protein